MGSVGAAGGRGDPNKTIMQVKEENLRMSENTDYFTMKATIIFVKQENFAYPACLSEGCNKKVVEVDPGQWRCEKCNKTHPIYHVNKRQRSYWTTLAKLLRRCWKNGHGQ